ncbi:hypothetical protein [Streptomyces sp. PR69]|uniref:hypothetical protein n=1 Tax=Streptomyces sp. PR69 TaxID=2984950 RepID=UPI0022641241|nr:hypothetical protein [Streptomyces sp. PR69]
MNARRVNAAAGVILAAQKQGKTLAASLAYALESACLLQSPETADEQKRLRVERNRYRAAWGKALTRALALRARVAELEARLGEYERPVDEDPIAYALTGQAGTTQALLDEDTADILTLAAAQYADATYDATFRTIRLELTATPEQWSAWQEALDVDLTRTTNRGSCVTSHATWRGIHVVICCWPARPVVGNQDGPGHHDYAVGRDLPEPGVTP